MTIGFFGGKFLPLHLGHVNAIIQASNMCDTLYVIISHSKKRDYNLCRKKANIKYIPAKVRISWLKQITKDMQNVIVIDVEDSSNTNEDYNWFEGAQRIKKKIGKKIDLIFSSEESYSKIFSELYPDSKHIIIDSKRELKKISATQIRKEGVFKHWNFLPDVVKPFFVKKVVFVGTESCGKSTLVRNLAKLYNTSFVEEYGRTLCEEKGGSELLLKEDYQTIAFTQKVLENNAIKKSNKIVFIDTESLITKYYLKLYENIETNLFDSIAKHQNYDLWIYLEPDVKWVDDNTRKYGETNIRNKNNFELKKILNKHNINYICISGNYQKRFLQCISLIENNLLNENANIYKEKLLGCN